MDANTSIYFREFWEAIQITTDPTWALLKLQEITAPKHIPGIFGRGETNIIVFRNDRTTLQGALNTDGLRRKTGKLLTNAGLVANSVCA